MTLRWQLGVNATLDPKSAEADAVLIAKLGGVNMRTSQEQPWGSVLSRLGPFATSACNHGLELFQTCQPTGHVVPKTQAGMDAWGLFVAECAVENPCGRTSLGNEINGFGSKETPNPRGQAEMILAAAAACAKHAPDARLVTPSMCPASGPLGASYVEPLLFFDAMVAAEPSILAIPHLVVDWHGYCGFGYPAGTPATWNQCYRTRALHADLVKLGYPNMRIAWSEFGEPSGSNVGVSLAVQAQRFDQYIVEAGLQESQAGVRHNELIWYCLRDRAPANSSDWPAWCGLVDRNGNPKPVAARFTAAAKLVA
jgi:hypothetical protein